MKWGICRLIPDTSSLCCPCLLTAEQSLHLHSLRGHFWDVCARGKGKELSCQIAREARVKAASVTLKLQGIPGTVYSEISNNTSGREGPSQRTQVDRSSIPPQVTSGNPLSTETDGRRVRVTTTSARMELVIPVVLLGVFILGVRVLILWSIAECVWLFTVVSAARNYGPCKFIPNTGFLSCPCTMSWSQILRLHNLRQFQDTCTRGKGNELHCQIAREARVEAGGVTLNYTRGIPGTVFCEIHNTLGGEGPSQRTQVDWLSIPPQMTSGNPLSTETDGRRVRDKTTSARMELVIPVVLVLVVLIGVPVLVLWWQRGKRCRRRSVEMETHREIPLSGLIPQAARPSGLPSASDTPEESAPTRPITPHD
ncbi:uncharacterized protein LOC132385355 [Hypanus sabinus]|uniref:uncharacterized protein LOC132385355 n=1 Tax=Hypanus sabinus TaxID=79690 RepID=UPI0028C3BC1B|nr:uncharacterized protein LOC132385355 [Hypanus sabinus]